MINQVLIVTSLDLIGTLAFAISGALAAIDKKLDLFGILVIAFVTALGGGTLRDLLMGQQPVGWMLNTEYLYIVLIGAVIAFFARQSLSLVRHALFAFDAAGLAVFTILGVEKALAIGLSPSVAVMMGVTSAVFGGVIRDILCNEIPLIFRQEIYATACILGAILYLCLLPWIEPILVIILTIHFILILRVLSVRFKWQLPVPDSLRLD